MRLVLRRILLVIPQLLGISILTFTLVRLLPGDPAYTMLGTMGDERTIQAMRERMGLDQPVHVQYINYLRGAITGDLGNSWYTGQPVAKDLVQRFGATFELTSVSLAIVVVVMVPLGLYAAGRTSHIANLVRTYGRLAGAIPDFWLGLLFIYVFYYRLGWAPVPIGRLDVGIPEFDRITGINTLDALLSGNWVAFASTTAHLLLPAVTLAIVYGATLLKMTIQAIEGVLQEDYIRVARSKGLTERLILTRHVLRAAIKPMATTLAVTYGYLLGGAVLVETVFSWGGLGQYVVQAVFNADFAAVQGFVLVAASFTAGVYLVLDLLYMIFDPRIRIT